MNVGTTVRVGLDAGALTPGRWALVAGAAGIAANLLLVLFFVLAQPWRSADSAFAWLGPANDILVVAQFAALVPVAVAVRDRLGGRLVRTATGAAVAAMAAIAVLQLGLLAGVLGFDVEAPLVIGCQLVIFGWLLVIGRADAMPRGLARFGTAVAASFLFGTVIAALAALPPWGSPAAFVGFAVAVLIGLPGRLGFGVWPLLVARQMFKEET